VLRGAIFLAPASWSAAVLRRFRARHSFARVTKRFILLPASQSARGLAHSKTLREARGVSHTRQRLGVRRSSAAFERGITSLASQSARGLAHSKTLREARGVSHTRQRLGVRRSSAAFERVTSPPLCASAPRRFNLPLKHLSPASDSLSMHPRRENALESFEAASRGFTNPSLGFTNPPLGFTNPALGITNLELGFTDPTHGFTNPAPSQSPEPVIHPVNIAFP